MALTVIATYDITDDKRRSRVAAMLQVWGTRIQYSVYLLVIEEEELNQLVTRVGEVLSLREDACRFLRQCSRCWEDGIQVGRKHVQDREPAFVVL